VTDQQQAFRDIIDVFNKEGVLPYVMLIGSWAEYIYQSCLIPGFRANLRTSDVDFLYTNLKKPQNRKLSIIEGLKEKGFLYVESRGSAVGKFVKEDLLELEFLTRALGEGRQVNCIPSLNINAVGLRELNMLGNYPLVLDYQGFKVTVPEPEAYVLHKLLINQKRKSGKKEKDIESVEGLMSYIDLERAIMILASLPKKNQRAIDATMALHHIRFKKKTT